MREWLPLLNLRQKWTETRPDLKISDAALVIFPDSSRGHWPLGRVLAVFPGKHGHIRVAKIQVSHNTVVRPVSEIKDVILPSQEGKNG